jgi:hypothetical protein
MLANVRFGSMGNEKTAQLEFLKSIANHSLRNTLTKKRNSRVFEAETISKIVFSFLESRRLPIVG